MKDVSVGFYVGDIRRPVVNQKWFYCWQELLQKDADLRCINSRYPDELSCVLNNKLFSKLRSREVLNALGSKMIFHIATQLHAHYFIDLISKRPVVVTCFDALPYLEDSFSLSGVRYSEKVISCQKEVLLNSDVVLTCSDYSRQTLLDLGVESSKLHTVHCGVNLEHYYRRQLSGFKKEQFGYSSDSFNLLYVGTEAPRKNIVTIIEVLHVLKERGVNVRLVKVGRKESRGELIRKKIKEYGLEAQIFELTHVSEENMPLLYSGADVFIFPTYFEGFGLPVLEAMATECPVITSNVTSIPEVVGDAAKMFDPDNVDGMVAEVLNLIKNPDLRLELGKRGRERAKLFGWQKTAQTTMGIYKELVKK